MRTIKFDNNGKEEEITVLSASGYHDGYYWDMSATILYNDVEYSIQDAGSGSGYVPHYSSISKDGPRKLVTLMQLCESEAIDEDDRNDWEYIESTICDLLYDFLKHECKESLEYIEADDNWSLELHVDGQKIEEEEG